jgi:NAD+ diphosphatase
VVRVSDQSPSERLLPHVALSAYAHNRMGLRRTDRAWLDERMADPATRVLVVAGNRLRPVDGAIEWVAPDRAPGGRLVLLGERDGVVHLAVVVAPEDAEGAPEEWVPLRGVLGILSDHSPDQAPLLMHAIGLAEWHHATRFCPRCGGTLESRAAGHELRCTQCDRAQFPRTDPAVIMAITSGDGDDEAILLGRNRAWAPDRWSTLAGFCEPGETLEDAVRREVHEEVGVRVGEVGYFGSQPWPLPASLMLGFTGRATSTDIDVDGAEIEEARWWTRADFEAAGRSGELVVPRGISISSSLIESWFGRPLDGPGWG